MPGCCVPQCSNHSRNGWRMFHFPRDPKRRLLWLVRIRRDKWQPTNSSCICSAHFEDRSFEQHRADGWKKLKPNAVPTVFPFNVQTQSEKPPLQQTCPASSGDDFRESLSRAQDCASGSSGASANYQESTSDCAPGSADVSSTSPSAAQQCLPGSNDMSERHREDIGDYVPGSTIFTYVSSPAPQEGCSGSSDSEMSEKRRERISDYAAGSADVFSMSTSELVKEVLELRKKNSILQKHCFEANKKLKRERLKTKHLRKELSTVNSNLNILSEHINMSLQKASSSSILPRRASWRQKLL